MPVIPLPQRWRVFAPKLLIAICVFTSIALFTLIFRPNALVFETPLSEDGFYMLSVTRYLALGRGLTIDGVHWTNGFQPLLTVLLVPIYWLTKGELYQSLRGVIMVHWLTHLVTAWLVARIVAHYLQKEDKLTRHVSSLFAAVLWLTSRHVIINNYNALETGFVLMFEAGAWYLYVGRWRQTRLGQVAFGIVLGLMVLARIDSALLVVLVAAGELVFGNDSLRGRVVRSLFIVVVAVVVSSPWWLYNLTFFGSLMPTSGSAQSLPFSPTRFKPMFEALLQNAVPFVHYSGIEGNVKIALQLGVGVVVLVLFAMQLRKHNAPVHANAILGIMLGFVALLAGYYIYTSFAYYFYARYLAPLMLIAIVVTGIAVGAMPRLHMPALLGSVALALIAALTVYRYSTVLGDSSNKNYTDQYTLIQAYVPPNERVAAGQSGTIGYFREGVTNLDGKVNQSALNYRGRMWEYLDQEKITWYCDWSDSYWLGLNPEANGWQLVARRGNYLLYRRV